MNVCLCVCMCVCVCMNRRAQRIHHRQCSRLARTHTRSVIVDFHTHTHTHTHTDTHAHTYTHTHTHTNTRTQDTAHTPAADAAPAVSFDIKSLFVPTRIIGTAFGCCVYVCVCARCVVPVVVAVWLLCVVYCANC